MNGHGRERPLQLHDELLQRSGRVVSDRRLPVRAVFPNNKIGGFLDILRSWYQSGVVCSVAGLEDFPSAVMRSPTGTAAIFRTGCWGVDDDLFRR
jgi:hypothetical protein